MCHERRALARRSAGAARHVETGTRGAQMADASAGVAPLCKHFARGMCLFGAGCVFRHEMPPPPKVRQLTEREHA